MLILKNDIYDNGMVICASKSDKNFAIRCPVFGNEEFTVIPNPSDVIPQRSILRHVVVT